MVMRVVELFAGVGGFRIGLEGPPCSPRDEDFAVVWSNQWEPSTKKQHAAEVYAKRWGLTESKEKPLHFIGDGEVFVNDDIATIDVEDIPDHDLLVGVFHAKIIQSPKLQRMLLELKERKESYGGKSTES